MMLTPDLTNALTLKKEAFRYAVLSCTQRNFRDYPWRHQQQNPYAILLAELLLKRTTATAAARAYLAFFGKYPTILQLATATEEELRQDLSPLGLHNQRAKAIAGLAKYILENENGMLPNSLEHLLRIPGLGPYSARAILSFGFNTPAAVVDGNVERVIQRVFWGAMPQKPSRPLLQAVADNLLPQDAHRELNFGLLDLGAVVCRYSGPRHDKCCLTSLCDFYMLSQSKSLLVVPAHHRLRELRVEKGYTLTELARKAEVSKITIIKIEAGRTAPQQKTVHKLAQALEVEPCDLASQD